MTGDRPTCRTPMIPSSEHMRCIAAIVDGWHGHHIDSDSALRAIGAYLRDRDYESAEYEGTVEKVNP